MSIAGGVIGALITISSLILAQIKGELKQDEEEISSHSKSNVIISVDEGDDQDKEHDNIEIFVANETTSHLRQSLGDQIFGKVFKFSLAARLLTDGLIEKVNDLRQSLGDQIFGKV